MNPVDVRDHWSGSREVIHSDTKLLYLDRDQIELQVTVDA